MITRIRYKKNEYGCLTTIINNLDVIIDMERGFYYIGTDKYGIDTWGKAATLKAVKKTLIERYHLKFYDEVRRRRK